MKVIVGLAANKFDGILIDEFGNIFFECRLSADVELAIGASEPAFLDSLPIL